MSRLKFRSLRSDERLPVGSLVDARHGKLKVVAAIDSAGDANVATVTGGVFMILQRRSGPAELVLRPPQRRCRAGRLATRLAVQAESGFETRTPQGTAAESGASAAWTTESRCGSTTVKVTTGSVRATNVRSRRTATVRARRTVVLR